MKQTRLKTIMQYVNITAEELAKQTGLSTSGIYAMANGQSPNLENAVKISTVLGHPIQDLWPDLFPDPPVIDPPKVEKEETIARMKEKGN